MPHFRPFTQKEKNYFCCHLGPYFFSFLDFQDFFDFCYLPWFLLGLLLKGFCVGARATVVARECGAVSGVVSGFSALNPSAFLDAPFSFFLGEVFDVDGVDIHGIWIDFWVLVVGVVLLKWGRGCRIFLQRWHLLCPIGF